MRKLSIKNLQALSASRPEGYFDDVMSHAAERDSDHIILTDASYDLLQQKYSPEKFAERMSLLQATGLDFVPPNSGPGSELKKLLALVGITASATCSCNRRAISMDANGADWCEANIDTIVGWLREEAEKRGLPFLDVAGRMLVRRAIRNARRAVAS